MKSISKYNRIGIEAEIHTYTIISRIANKIVLASSSCKVTDGDLDLPLLQLVSEGANTGTSYFELVFGPVVHGEIDKVFSVIEIAKEVKLMPKPIKRSLTVDDWVIAFNRQLKGKWSIFKLNVVVALSNLEIQRASGNSDAVSIQANVLTPISLFSNPAKVNDFFQGMPSNTFPFITVYDKIKKIISSMKSGSQTVTQTAKGAIFLAAYFCFIYSKNNKEFGANCDKTIFPILPKIELLSTLKETCAEFTTDEISTILKSLSDLFTSHDKCFQNNVEFLRQNMDDTNSNIKITPRFSGVLPIYSSGRKRCVVMEFRKGELSVLKDISNKRIPLKIWE